jgi:membrane-bound lytic murein transglycosylase B
VHQRRLHLLFLALLLVPPGVQSAVQRAKFDLKRPEIVAFVNDVVRRDSLNRRKVLHLLAKAEPQPKIIEAMTRPAEKVTPWWEYQARFLTEERISEGAQFYVDHRETLERIAKNRGIPPEYLVAIMGVETKYGRVTGHYRVLDALMTLAFDYPPRSDYFRGELEQFLLLSAEEHLDPLTVTGSYAGAMGVPQFMPSSYRLYAVDGDTDNKRDLWSDWDDILASIANYFVEHGWEAGGPVLAETRLDPEPKFQIDTRNLELNETVDSLNAEGVEIVASEAGTTPAVLISAEQQDGPAYRVGFKNFYVITRYNRSARYAMAVHDLATAIAQRVAAPQSELGSAVAPPADPPSVEPQSPSPRP